MDISFHYFAVKSVASAAGYPEEKAQRIAEFSQFIDDYNWYVHFIVNNIPAYVKADDLDIVFNGLLNMINPVTTGFSDWIDLATLVIPRSQRYTVSPFHFIPQDKASCDANDYRTVPAVLNDGSYISDMLNSLKDEIQGKTISEADGLMKMGMLFHTFADTYAHQLFTGFNNQSNSVGLLSATDNISGKDVTEQYHFWIEQWTSKIEKIIGKSMPTIGHMAIAHIPDLTHLSFSMSYKSLDGKKYVHTRSNTSTFILPCKQLYNFLRDCLGKDSVPNMSWNDLSEKLAEGFLIDASQELNTSEAAAVAKLKPHWSSIFKDFKYNYNSEAIKERFVLKTAKAIKSEPVTVTIGDEQVTLLPKSYTDEFYKYNVFADQHLINLYGPHPRNLLTEVAVAYDNIQLSV